jgi:hypothetical protein
MMMLIIGIMGGKTGMGLFLQMGERTSNTDDKDCDMGDEDLTKGSMVGKTGMGLFLQMGERTSTDDKDYSDMGDEDLIKMMMLIIGIMGGKTEQMGDKYMGRHMGELGLYLQGLFLQMGERTSNIDDKDYSDMGDEDPIKMMMLIIGIMGGKTEQMGDKYMGLYWQMGKRKSMIDE